MKKLHFFLLLAASVVATSADAQLRVDSLGRSEFGARPDEKYSALEDGEVTIYGDWYSSVLNLYTPRPDFGFFPELGTPYFIQCVTGDKNKPSSILQPGNDVYHRLFYVDANGLVYSKKGTIQAAVDPVAAGTTVLQASIPASRKQFQTPLSRLDGITGVSYSEERVNGASANAMTASDSHTQARQRLGLLAEEVEAGVPEAVVTLDDGTKGISYSDLVVVLIDAVNELNGKVQALEAQLAETRSLAPQLADATASMGAADADRTYLEQNAPNPANAATVIRYGLADNVTEAFICIYDLQGRQVKRLDLSDREGQVTVAASELGAGIYIYSLIADGREADSRRMILTD